MQASKQATGSAVWRGGVPESRRFVAGRVGLRTRAAALERAMETERGTANAAAVRCVCVCACCTSSSVLYGCARMRPAAGRRTGEIRRDASGLCSPLPGVLRRFQAKPGRAGSARKLGPRPRLVCSLRS